MAGGFCFKPSTVVNNNKQMAGDLNQLSDALNRSADVLFSLRDINADVSTATKENTFAINTLTEFLKDSQSGLGGTGIGGADGNKAASKGESVAGGSKVNFKELAKSLTGFAEALPKMAVGVAKFKKTNTEPFINFLEKVIDAMSMKGKIKSSSGITKMYTAFSDMFTAMGTGLQGMGNGLLTFGIAAKLGQKPFLEFLDKFSKSKIFTLKSDSAKDTAQAFLYLSKGIKDFSIGMALATPLLIIGAPGFILMAGMMYGLSIISKSIDIKSSKEFAGSMLLMSGALVLTSLSFLVTRLLEPEDVIKGIGMMAGLGLTMFLIGSAKQYTMDGAVVMLAASVSMIGVAFAINMLAKIDGTKLAGVSVALGALIIAPVITLGLMSAITWQGVAALAGIGLAYMAISYSLKKISEINPDALLKSGAALGVVIGTVIGVGIPPVALLVASGSAALLLMGGAMLSLGFGLKKIQDLNIDENNIDSFTSTISKVADTFFEIGGPIDTPMIMSGAATGIAIGGALYSIGKGIKEFVGLNIDYKAVGNNIAELIKSITTPLAEIGKGGFFFNDTETGVEAIEDLGQNIYSLALGVQSFSRLEFKGSDGKVTKITSSDIAMVGTNIGNLIKSITTPLAEIGKGGFFFNDTETGVEAIEGLGTNVYDLAKGVKEMATLQFTDAKGKTMKLSQSDLLAVGTNIGNLILSITKPLAEIGKGGFFFNDTETGVEAIQGLGKSVGEIIGTVKSVADMSKKGLNFNEVRKFVLGSMSSILTPIQAFVNNDKYDLDEISDYASDLKDLAEDLNPVFTQISKVTELIAKDDKAGLKLNNAITSVALGFNSFSLINKKVFDMKSKNLVVLADMVSKIASADPKAFAENAKSFNVLGDGFKKLADAISKITENQFKQFNTFIQALTEMEAKATDVMNKKVEATQKIAATISKTTVPTATVAVSGQDDARLRKIEEENKLLKETNEAMVEQITLLNNSMRQLISIMSSPHDVRVVNQGGFSSH